MDSKIKGAKEYNNLPNVILNAVFTFLGRGRGGIWAAATRYYYSVGTNG